MRIWLGQVSKAYRAVDAHARRRLRHWLCRKHRVGGRGTARSPDGYLHETLGLMRLEGRKRSFRGFPTKVRKLSRGSV
jgi:RNA-directed DNA polymerase